MAREILPVTAIVTVSNEPFLFVNAAIRSVIADDVAEVIVVIDAAEERDNDFVGRVARFPGVSRTIVLPVRMGVSHARNLALESARMPWIAFLDGDDTWVNGKTLRQMAALSALDTDARVSPPVSVFAFASSKAEQFVEEGYEMPETLRREKLGVIDLHFPSNLLCRRELFDYVGGFDPRLVCANDVDWYHRAMKLGAKRVHVDEVLVRKRVHDQNLSLCQGHDMQKQIMSVLTRPVVPGMHRTF